MNLQDTKINLTSQEAKNLLLEKLVLDPSEMTSEEFEKLNTAVNMAIIALENEAIWKSIECTISQYLKKEISAESALNRVKISLFRKQGNDATCKSD